MDDSGTWWAPGLSLADRLTVLRSRPGEAVTVPHDAGYAAAAAARVEAWRSDYPAAESFRGRLADLGLDEEALRALIAQGPPAGRADRPAWAATAEAAIAAAPQDPPRPGAPDGRRAAPGWGTGFAAVLAPFAANAAEDLMGRHRELTDGGLVDAAALRRCFTEQLGKRLVALAARTLVLELNLARAAGRLAGDTPEARFADFVRVTSSRSGLRTLLAGYPVLARLLAQTCAQDVEAWSELLARFAADRPALVAEFFDGADPGPVTEVTPGAGDRHQGGRSVALLGFASGARVVFKPRPVAVHARFNDTLRWLNSHLPALAPRTLRVLERPGCGWVEFVPAEPCADRAQVARFYWRVGALLALVHALGGTDLHAENLIACGAQPVAVDVETLLHPLPARPSPQDPALAALRRSVQRTALLPAYVVGDHGSLDISALGGDRDTPLPGDVTDWDAPGTDMMRLVRTQGVFRGAANRPRLDGLDADPAAYAEDLLAGFRAAHRAIRDHRGDLLGPDGLLARFAGVRTRAVLRNTRWYATLLDESTHPEVLRDALDRDRLLDVLWRESVADPVLRPLVAAELAELWAGDVPLIGCRTDATELTVGARTVAGLVSEHGLGQAERRLAAMDGADCGDQEWVIRASLATRSGPHSAQHPVQEQCPDEDEEQDLGRDQARDTASSTGPGVATGTGTDPAPVDVRTSAAPAPEPAPVPATGPVPAPARAAAAPTPAPAAGLRPAPGLAAVSGVAPDPERLLSAACGIADRMLAAAHDNGRRVNWLGLTPLDDRLWAVLPLGAGLPHGYGGTALFLAQLGALTGIERYTAAARSTLGPVPGLLARLAGRAEDLAAIGTGYAGLGGIAYALSRLAVLLDDRGIAGWADTAVRTAAEAGAAEGVPPGLMDGDAGCLAAMLAVWEESGSPLAARTAHLCAERLSALGPDTLPAGGFDTGAAGIGWALLRHAQAGGGTSSAAAGHAALATAVARHTTPPGTPLHTGWCQGPTGTALALSDSGGAPEGPASVLLAAAVAAAAQAAPSDHSLCHGETAVLDFLLTATTAKLTAPETLHRRAGAMLAALDRSGPRCGTPDAVTSPGLVTGLAGIGFGLIRLGFPTVVPSPLLLRTPARHAGAAPPLTEGDQR